MLRLPSAGEDPGPLIAYPSPLQNEADEIVHEEEDHDQEGHESAEEKEGGMLRFVAMLAIPSVILLGVFAWLLMPKERNSTEANLSDTAAKSEQAVPTEEAKPETETRIASTDAVQQDAVAKNFLEAPTMEEALKWIRSGEKLRPKLVEWYTARPYQAPGFKGSAGESLVLAGGETMVIGMAIRTGDFETRQLPMVRTPEGFRVDWESWVAWSEMSWVDFKKQKPSGPKLFRVISSPGIYYNFEFKDESKWVCFKLESLDGEDTLYGYAPTGSDLAARLRPLDGVVNRKVMLKLRFPENSATDNQVLIEEIAGDGWVDLSAER